MSYITSPVLRLVGASLLIIWSVAALSTPLTHADSQKVVISEIHAKNDSLPEYVEFHFLVSFSGTLNIVGAGRGDAAIPLSFQAGKGQYIVVASSLSWFLDPSVVQVVSGLSLRDGGETLTLSQWHTTLFSALFTRSATKKSLYPNMGAGQTVVFDVADFPTPGFGHQAVGYFSHVPLTSSTQVVSSTAVVPQEKYTTLKQTLTAKAKKYSNELTSLRQKFTLSQTTEKIRKTTSTLTNSYLHQQWQPVAQATPLQFLSYLTTQNAAAASNKHHPKTLLIGGYPFSVGTISKQYQYFGNAPFVVDRYMSRLFHRLYPAFGVKRTEQMQIWYK